MTDSSRFAKPKCFEGSVPELQQGASRWLLYDMTVPGGLNRIHWSHVWKEQTGWLYLPLGTEVAFQSVSVDPSFPLCWDVTLKDLDKQCIKAFGSQGLKQTLVTSVSSCTGHFHWFTGASFWQQYFSIHSLFHGSHIDTYIVYPGVIKPGVVWISCVPCVSSSISPHRRGNPSSC